MTGPTQRRLAVSGGDLCWFEWGAASPERPSLLLVHATGFHARCWDAVVAALPVGTHVIAPDLRGHGRSYRPASLSHWGESGDDLIPLIDALDRDVRLIAAGHSMGGVCIIRAAAARPDRFAHLLLVDPVVFAPEFYADVGRDPVGDPDEHFVTRRRNHWANADEMVARFATRFPYSIWDPAVLGAYAEYGLVPRAAGDGYELACPPRLEASAYLGSTAFNPLAAAGTLPCPVTVLRGRNGERQGALDFSISPTWPALATAFPHGRDAQWNDCTHFIPMEAPARLADFVMTETGLV
ncbi:MAG: alpha/beta hydrolase [Sphingopyxis sp.]|nr:alpha/beta hydrolase [Sphingopyxis sp.]